MAGCYLSPLLGGYISDVYLGRFRTIVAFNVSYIIGVAVWGATAFADSWPGCAVGLTLMALGTGGIKPNISPLGADQLLGASERQLVAYFFWFYFSVNFGSTIAYVCTPLVRVNAGYPPAILLGLAMLIASLTLLVIGRPWYRMLPPAGVSVYDTVIRVISAANPFGNETSGDSREDVSLLRSAPVDSHQHLKGDPAMAQRVEEAPSVFTWLRRATGKVPDADVEGTIRFFRILPLFACLPVFWMLFDSQDSVWTLQRKKMDLCVGSVCFAVEQLGAFNPILVMFLVPLFNMAIFPTLYALPDWLAWFRPSPLRQMAVGMQIAAIAFVVSAIVQSMVDSSPAGTVSLLWQLPQIFIITTAEILVSATGLEFAYSQAPPSFKGSILAMYYVSVACGDLLSAVVYSSLSSVLSSLYLLVLYAGLMCFAGILFIIAVIFYVPAGHSASGSKHGEVHKRHDAAAPNDVEPPLIVSWDDSTGKVKR